jgi:hypothetical protein
VSRRRMPNEEPPRKPGRPSRGPTRPVSLRMDVELWERLEHHAPLQRRSVTNLMQKLVADGLDWLDAVADDRVRELLQQNMRHLAAHIRPEEMGLVLKRQYELVQRLAGETPKRLAPLPKSMRGKPRRPRKRKR